MKSNDQNHLLSPLVIAPLPSVFRISKGRDLESVHGIWWRYIKAVLRYGPTSAWAFLAAWCLYSLVLIQLGLNIICDKSGEDWTKFEACETIIFENLPFGSEVTCVNVPSNLTPWWRYSVWGRCLIIIRKCRNTCTSLRLGPQLCMLTSLRKRRAAKYTWRRWRNTAPWSFFYQDDQLPIWSQADLWKSEQ